MKEWNSEMAFRRHFAIWAKLDPSFSSQPIALKSLNLWIFPVIAFVLLQIEKKTRIQDKIRKNSCEKTYGVDSGSKNIFIINNKYILTSEKSFCPELFIHNDSRFRNSVTFNTWPATKTRTDLAWKSDGIGLVNSNVDIFFRNILLKSFDWAVPDWEGTTEEEDLGEGIAKEIVAPKTRYVCTL